jgi:hypothetical protein
MRLAKSLLNVTSVGLAGGALFYCVAFAAILAVPGDGSKPWAVTLLFSSILKFMIGTFQLQPEGSIVPASGIVGVVCGISAAVWELFKVARTEVPVRTIRKIQEGEGLGTAMSALDRYKAGDQRPMFCPACGSHLRVAYAERPQAYVVACKCGACRQEFPGIREA